MGDIYMIWKKASFTVEAAFIFSIVIWILFSICYLSMYVHDRTAVYSLGQHYLEMALENGAEVEERELKEGLPFIKEILTGQEGKRIYLSHEKLNAPYIVWDSEVIKGRK